MSDLRKDGESLDSFMGGKLSILQKVSGYRFSIDSILLANFSSLRRGDRAVELGAGSGIVSMILALRDRPEGIAGVDIQESMVDMATRSARLNGLESCLRFVHADIRNIQEYFDPASFNAVLVNPPYRKIDSGRINPNLEKAAARHELNGAVHDFIKAARYLLKERGTLYVIFPARRAVTLISSMRGAGIEPKRIRLVYSDERSPAEFILAEGRKGSGEELRIDPPLFIYEAKGAYSSEVRNMFGDLSFFRNAGGG